MFDPTTIQGLLEEATALLAATVLPYVGNENVIPWSVNALLSQRRQHSQAPHNSTSTQASVLPLLDYSDRGTGEYGGGGPTYNSIIRNRRMTMGDTTGTTYCYQYYHT